MRARPVKRKASETPKQKPELPRGRLRPRRGALSRPPFVVITRIYDLFRKGLSKRDPGKIRRADHALDPIHSEENGVSKRQNSQAGDNYPSCFVSLPTISDACIVNFTRPAVRHCSPQPVRFDPNEPPVARSELRLQSRKLASSAQLNKLPSDSIHRRSSFHKISETTGFLNRTPNKTPYALNCATAPATLLPSQAGENQGIRFLRG
jgi:hypothetical protein